MRRAPITATAVLLVVLSVVIATAVSSTALLPSAPVLAGVLLGVGGGFAGWAGWHVGATRRARTALVPLTVRSQHRSGSPAKRGR